MDERERYYALQAEFARRNWVGPSVLLRQRMLQSKTADDVRANLLRYEIEMF